MKFHVKSRALTLLVRAFTIYVRPILEYCSVAWNPILKRDIETLGKSTKTLYKAHTGTERSNITVISIFFLLSFFLFSPNLSGRRLDVYNTSTHGVALVRIKNAGLKTAARGSLKTQDAKKSPKSPSGHHRTTLSGYIFAIKTHINNRKQLVKQQSSRCPHNMVNFGLLV